jgi:methyl-accepting chemotaxis protein
VALLLALVRMATTLRTNQQMLAASQAEIVARSQAQQALQATLTERDGLDEQMRTLLEQHRAAKEHARSRAQTLLDDTTSLVSGPLSEVVDRVRTVQSTATSIERQVADADGVTAQVVEQAREVDAVILKLADSLHRIGGVASVINGLANQTNLLALNATIEAVRAGDAGRSFSVVASEVKELSRDTARFTEEIASIIESLRSDATAVTVAINAMSDGIGGIDTATAMIREEVSEQRSALEQLTRQAEQAITQARHIGDGHTTVKG